MAVPYHTHTFDIPSATKEEVTAGVATNVALTPSSVGSAAARNVEDFATAEQGRKADTAVQSEALAKVATTGEYGDLNNLPALGTAAGHSETDFATAHQGQLAESALQDGDVKSAAYHEASEFALADQALPDGGGVGQVLAKKSAANKETEWVTVDAAASLAYAPQSLSPEQQGQALTNIGASSLSGFRNKIDNGRFQLQSFTDNTAPGETKLVLDRWFLTNNATGSIGCVTTRADPLATFSSALMIQSLGGHDISGELLLEQCIEDVSTLSGNLATFTFFAQVADDPVQIESYLVQDFKGDGSDTVKIEIGTTTISEKKAWQKVTAICSVPAVPALKYTHNGSLKLFLRITLPAHFTRFISISNVSLVAGNATTEADPFEPRHPQQELQNCRRYVRAYATKQNISDLSRTMRTMPTETDIGGTFIYDAEFKP
ncbi:hypothetical protein [Brucella anthropi]|uniref:hypothetical protein n=1 Tax=Brucella anthropi TaxID=529 RepID=UPI00235DE1E9|nr:hypothetical protein [Brucella anthropi]